MSQRVETRTLVYHYGDTFDGVDIIWKDALGVPINLSGYDATMRVKSVTGSPAAATVLLLTSVASGGLTIDAPAGKVSINATPAQMTGQSLEQGQRYFFDLQVKNSQETQTLLRGEFWVDPEVTDD